MSELFPVFLKLNGRRVLLVGGGAVAAAKLAALRGAGADVHVVAPQVHDRIMKSGVAVSHRPFVPADLDEAWFVVAAATPEVNREVAAAAASRCVFVNAVDDPRPATAFLGGVVRREGVTLAISTGGEAPALAGLLREGLDAVLPPDLEDWARTARRLRLMWRRDRVPMPARRPHLLDALNDLYGTRRRAAGLATGPQPRPAVVPWLGAPEDSWL